MVKPEQIPKECLVAYQRAFKAGGGPADGIAAALNAWPGMAHDPGALVTETYRDPGKIILPLPQEASDE